MVEKPPVYLNEHLVLISFLRGDMPKFSLSEKKQRAPVNLDVEFEPDQHHRLYTDINNARSRIEQFRSESLAKNKYKKHYTAEEESCNYLLKHNLTSIVRIYFISDGTALKIGHAKDIGERLRTLQPGNPRKLKCIGYFYGPKNSEASTRRQFNQGEFRGEWVELVSELEIRQCCVDFTRYGN